MNDCILSSLTHLQLIKTNLGKSQTLIVKGNYEGKDVVLKMSFNKGTDTSLEVERAIYMFINTDIKQFSPHFLAGIQVGQCDASYFLESDLKWAWHELRGYTIVQSTNKKKYYEDQFYQKYQKEPSKYPKSFFRFVSLATIKNPLYQQLHYVMTPEIKGQTLREWLCENHHTISETIEYDIVIQVAQALSVAEKFQLMHYDLHPNNIFITILEEPILLNYQYPFSFELSTTHVITIYDFDFGTVINIIPNQTLTDYFCEKLKMCNRFVPKYDWYVFLFNFFQCLKRNQSHSSLEFLIQDLSSYNKPPLPKIGYPLEFGRPCMCMEIKDNKCNVCELMNLDTLMSPFDFLSSIYMD